MNNIDYQHNVPPSPESKLIQFILGLIGMKKRMEKRMITNTFEKNPAKIPGSLSESFIIREVRQNERKVWTISPKEAESDVVVLYLHGGAYMGNINKQHWDFIEQLTRKINAVIVVPDYPLAPEATCKETFEFLDVLYTSLLIEFASKRILFMGDSAGGGLACGFAQQVRNKHIKQPEQIVVFSPWLDISMNNPDISFIEKKDKILSYKGLKTAGLKYAGNLDVNDYRVSPIYGDLTGICRISVFTGTNDLLHADARRFKQLMRAQNISFNYFEYPKMFHDWIIITNLKESKDVLNKVYNIVNDDEENKPVD